LEGSRTPRPNAAPILSLLHRARAAQDAATLDFMAVNDTHQVAPYRQAALWIRRSGMAALSGVAHPEANAPYVQWLRAACSALADQPVRTIDALALPPAIGEQWPEWLPAHGLWVPIHMPGAAGPGSPCAVLLARDDPWSEDEVLLVSEWLANWAVIRHQFAPLVPRGRWRRGLAAIPRLAKTALAIGAILAAATSIDVPLSVMAPGELVGADPMAIRAPIDGVIREINVLPNQSVRPGDRLVSFDTIQLRTRLDVATQAVLTAEAELRQYEQQSLADPRARAALPTARGSLAEKRAEAEYLRGQVARAEILAPQAGIAIFDDPQEWTGKPVAIGERILRLASEDHKEIEAWVAIGDAIPLKAGSPVRLYLASDPLSPVPGIVRYVAYDSQKRPDGVYAYRVRASLAGETPHRIGLKGSVRLSGEPVSVAYWIFRRPLATIREFLGL
jgi:hypothetical protein